MTIAARTLAVLAVVAAIFMWSAPPPAQAISPTSAICSLTGVVSTLASKLCNVAAHPGRVLSAGQQLLGGHLGGALESLAGGGGSTAARAVGLVAVAAAVVGGARYLLAATAKVIGATTRPNLTSTWFSATYWRMAAVAALLTVPFLLAAAVQAILRSDLALLGRAAFGYLPLGMLAVGVAAPLTMLLLAGSDEMSALISSASGHAGASFLDRAGGLAGVIDVFSGNVFVSFFVALLTAAATLTLWIELLIRDAAVYVIVFMLPLFFAAMVWPARRVWAIRAVELLVALILSKFAIVAVLSLGGAALGHTLLPGLAAGLTGTTLVMLAAFSPWALMRLLPLHEVAAAAVGGLRPRGTLTDPAARAGAAADAAERMAEIHGRLNEGQAGAGSGSDAQGAGTSSSPAVAGDERDEAAARRGEAGVPASVDIGVRGDPAPGATEHSSGAGPAPSSQDANARAAAAADTGNASTGSGGPTEMLSTSDDGGRGGPMHPVPDAPNHSWRKMGFVTEDMASDRPLVEDVSEGAEGSADAGPSVGPADSGPPFIAGDDDGRMP